MDNKFQVNSYIQKISTLVDGGCKLDIITQELDPSEATILFSLKGKQGWFLFKESSFEEVDLKDVPETSVEFKSDKTPSQRLRNIIYRYWEQQDSKGEWETFYKRQIELLINKIKDLLKEDEEL
jgi:hypothetical protein